MRFAVCLKFDSSPTRAKSIPVGSLDPRRDPLANLWFLGAIGELAVSAWGHAYLDPLHRRLKRLFGARREGGGALKGLHGSPRFFRHQTKGFFGALRRGVERSEGVRLSPEAARRSTSEFF